MKSLVMLLLFIAGKAILDAQDVHSTSDCYCKTGGARFQGTGIELTTPFGPINTLLP